MAPEFLNLELKINLLLEANTSINIISKILKKSSKSIYNTIQCINKKKKLNYPILNRVKRGRIKKISPREKRVINRDLTKSPKMENNLDISKRTL